jgi:hypothetical protein
VVDGDGAEGPMIIRQSADTVPGRNCGSRKRGLGGVDGVADISLMCWVVEGKEG